MIKLFRLFFSVLILFYTHFACANTFAPNTTYEVCFTPTQPCTEQIVAQINQAKTSINMQAYSLTSYPIIKALLSAYRRGVQVEVIVDKSQFKAGVYSRVNQLLKAGIPVWKDDSLNIAHNKVMIFDKHIVETGSFNYTTSAQKYNAENVLIIDNSTLAQQYLANWTARQKVSKPMKAYETRFKSR